MQGDAPTWLRKTAAVSWRLLVVAAALVLTVIVAYRLRIVTVPVMVASAVAVALSPVARWLIARRWPPLLATWTVLIGALALIVGIFIGLGQPLGEQFEQLGPELTSAVEAVESWLIEGPLGLSPQAIDQAIEQAITRVQENAEAIGSGLLSGAVLILEVVAGLFLTLVIAFFFIKDGDTIRGWLVSLAPERLRPSVEASFAASATTLAAYLRGTAIVGVVNAVVIGVGLALIGVPLALLLASLTFIGAFFPLIGATVAGAVAAMVALVSVGPFRALLVVALVVAVQQIEGDVLSPIVMGRALRLHPLVILLVLAAGALIGGLLGALLAVPFTAVGVAIAGALREVPPDPPVTEAPLGQGYP